MVDSGKDPDILDAIEKFGDAGYTIFFRLLEIMAREFDIKRPGYNDFSVHTLSKLLGKNPKSFLKVLDFFHKRKRIFRKTYGQSEILRIKLNCPKLRKLADEWTHKLLRKTPETAPEPLRPIEEEGEVRVYKYKKLTSIPSDFENFHPEGLQPPDKFLNYLGDKNPGSSFQDLFEDFVIYHKKKGSKFKDWFAAWQTWVRNDIKFNGPAKFRADGTEYNGLKLFTPENVNEITGGKND
jgi:hypothetical protein